MPAPSAKVISFPDLIRSIILLISMPFLLFTDLGKKAAAVLLFFELSMYVVTKLLNRLPWRLAQNPSRDCNNNAAQLCKNWSVV